MQSYNLGQGMLWLRKPNTVLTLTSYPPELNKLGESD